jgi:hypothetical protein
VIITRTEPVEGGRRIISECVVEVEGQERPAVIAETIGVYYD